VHRKRRPFAAGSAMDISNQRLESMVCSVKPATLVSQVKSRQCRLSLKQALGGGARSM